MGLERRWQPRREHTHDEDGCPECSGRVEWVEIQVEWLGPEYTDFALVRDAVAP